MAHGPVRAELDRAIRNAERQKILYARHAGTVAAARALADKIDAWDVIVQFALEDMPDGGRPAVPQNDNVSLASFLKYMEALGLTVAADRAQAKVEAQAAARVKGAAAGVSKLEALQAGVGLRLAN